MRLGTSQTGAGPAAEAGRRLFGRGSRALQGWRPGRQGRRACGRRPAPGLTEGATEAPRPSDWDHAACSCFLPRPHGASREHRGQDRGGMCRRLHCFINHKTKRSVSWSSSLLNPDHQSAALTVWFSIFNKTMESGLFPRFRVFKKFQSKNVRVAHHSFSPAKNAGSW